MRKGICLLLAAFTIATGLTFPSCSEAKELKFPKYQDNKIVRIGGWDCPINTLADYQLAKDMGLDFMFLDSWRDIKHGTQDFYDVLGYCEQVGLEAILTTGCGQTVNNYDNWAADTTDYSQYAAVKAVNYWDEPYYNNFDTLEKILTDHIKKYGNQIDFYVNHFPNSATSTFGGKTYAEFIAEYVDRILMKLDEGHRYLSADIYPLEEKNGTSYVRSNWLNCIETIAREGKRANATTHFFIQLTEHYDYRKVYEKDIRYQFYVYMAFGIDSFSYFTYRDGGFGSGRSCVSGSDTCTPNEQYYWAQAVNNEIHAFDHVYMNFDWTGTLPVLGTLNLEGYNLNFDGLSNSLEKVDILNAVTATQDTLIGQFKDKEGNDGLIITNFVDPAKMLENTVKLVFKDTKKIRIYRKGLPYDYSIENNMFELKLDAGEGVFLIPATA